MSAEARGLLIDFEDWMNQANEKKGVFSPISKEKINEIYTLAYILYQNQQYQEARILFRLLIEDHPLEAKLWKGLGACLQMQKDYQEALNCYSYCVSFKNQNEIDPYLYIYIGDCHFALKQIKEGLKALEIAFSNAKKTDNQRILQHVTFMQQIWLKK